MRLDTTKESVQDVQETDRDLDQTLHLSEQEALHQEQADLQEAVMKSKADQRNSDGVTIVRLTFQSDQVRHHLATCEDLSDLTELVDEAGCEVSPTWAKGALLLVPITECQAIEADIVLKPHNIVILSEHVHLLKETLKKMPKRKRHGAEIRPENQADQPPAFTVPGLKDIPAANPDPSCPLNSDMEAEIGFEIVNTFINFPLWQLELSESSRVVRSAPADAASTRQDNNPRRWVASRS